MINSESLAVDKDSSISEMSAVQKAARSFLLGHLESLSWGALTITESFTASNESFQFGDEQALVNAR